MSHYIISSNRKVAEPVFAAANGQGCCESGVPAHFRILVQPLT